MTNLPILDCQPAIADMQAEVLQSLRREPPHLPAKYFYDARGAKLFEQICELPEYYPTRTEIQILQQALPQIAHSLGPQRWVLEPGSGSGIKTRMLLEALQSPAGYVPIDISKAQLLRYGASLQQEFANLKIRPVCADFTQDLSLPDELDKPVIWFPGSTIGNFSPVEAREFLQRLRRWHGGRCELLIGVDLQKEPHILEAAYNDAQGVTAEFNLNLLRHLEHSLDAKIDISAFRHAAHWNADIGAIQMFLVSQRDQILEFAEHRLELPQGQAICTEYSYKYQIQQFQDLSRSCGWQQQQLYTDPKRWFAIFHLA